MSIVNELETALEDQAIDGDWKESDESMAVGRYRHSSKETRDMVNTCLTVLCGYSFATLASNAGHIVTPHKKQKINWRIQTWE